MSTSKGKAPGSSRSVKAAPIFETINGELVELTKAGTVSRMRSHRGNKPTIPQSHPCHLCPARFTRPTHLHRHLRTHSNSRGHKCDRCSREFTRSDLLTRHKRSCGDPTLANRSRRKSCQACADGKTKCDLQQPCSRCTARGCECTYLRRPSVKSEKDPSSSPNPMSSNSPESSAEGHFDDDSFRPKYELTPPPPFAVPEVQHGTFLDSFPAAEFAVPAAPASLGSLPVDLSKIPSTSTWQEARDFNQDYASSYASSSYASTSHAPTLSGYSESTNGVSPSYYSIGGTSFAQDANKVKNELNALFSAELFDRFFHDYLAEDPKQNTQQFPSPTDMFASPFDVDNSSQFPFATEPRPEPQPFMGSVIPDLDEEFLNQLCTVPGPASFPPFAMDMQQPNPQHLAQPQMQPPLAAPPANAAAPYPSELQQYMHLFYQMFLYQMPVMHIATFTIEGKPQILLSAMQACGALYVKTAAASQFIDHTLKSAREQLMQEFAKKSSSTAEQMHLVLAVVLLQTIGLFHQRPDQRTQSNIYHPMLVSMIRQSELVQKVTSWQPPVITERTNMDMAWREWAFHETTKRALLLTYLHDTCHCIYFTQRPYFYRDEMTVPLPCEDGLWRANSPGEWYALLQLSSEYGTQERRFRPHGLQDALVLFADTSNDDTSPPLLLTPFAHFVLSHAILRKLFEDCIERPSTGGAEESEPTPESLSVQYMLHKWLRSWVASPDTPHYSDAEEPRFLFDALPFYWIAQVALLAYQERLPPFTTAAHAAGEALGEAKFRLVKEWLRHIRQFLRKGEQGPTLFWDELHKIRRRSQGKNSFSDTESLGAVSDDSEGPGGLLGFFAGET
ncbi:fungal-specific transcription factor domain-containing protein [Phanerochaete sordida]|uniref:Fungal-specific transcription factor domain-containing protein n=1 Tax=Phanerochaete sordida TaxID=48140 RepID=A0A9P3LJT3_9APHY|nr:fungal-specific transcription factor domain-containing protein [Phanerochaete sordida]